MSNIFDQGAMVSDLGPTDPVPLAEPGTIRLIARQSRLFGVLPNGAEVRLTSPSVLKDGAGLVFSAALFDFRGKVDVIANGDIVTLQFPKVEYFEAVTNGAGQWSVAITGFTRVDFVTPQAIKQTGDVSEQAIATLHQFTNSAANGRVVESNALVFLLGGGGQGLEYAESGVRVRVRVEGI